MNFFGIGTLELLVILLVAFVALGPGKTVEVARTIGRMAREARRTFTDIVDAASVDDRGTSRGSGGAEQRRSTTAPPSDPLSTPAHLAAQSPDAPAEAADAPASPDGPPSSR